jgi:hypothetical protein
MASAMKLSAAACIEGRKKEFYGVVCSSSLLRCYKQRKGEEDGAR